MIEFVDPWEPPVDADQASHFEDQLSSELLPGHSLYGKSARALAHRFDRDDVLFEIAGGPEVAVVHLTYSRNITADFPQTELYASIAVFARERLSKDHDEYEN